MGAERRSALDRFLGLFAEVRAGEGLSALLLAVNVFLLLTSYYGQDSPQNPSHDDIPGFRAAMEAANITGDSGTLNRQAKSAARSAFESAKQRFFGHLLTSMKTPTLISSIEADLAAGHAAVIQIVSTGEALMERRLSDIPTEEWNDIRVDITPREYVLDYLAHSFPVQLYEPFTDSEGNLSSRPVVRDGQPVECREAARRRDALIEKLASLPPVPGALDQIVQRFGTDLVA